MNFLSSLEQFHFLRPYWLFLLIPAAFLMWSVVQRSDSLRAWRKVVQPHLLEHLLIHDGVQSGKWRPVYMLGIGWLVGILALAGPSWQMVPSPFSEDQAALFIVVKVTPGMLAQDIQPSRLQRSVLKIHDLLEYKKDTRTGLIAYAGSAHLVMPLTSDSGVINNFAAALEPAIMPLAGDEPAEAILLASQRLRKAAAPGSIVLITDAIDASQLSALQDIHQQERFDVHILAMAAGPEVIPPAGSHPARALDLDSLSKAARVMGGTVTVVSADKSDVRSLSTLVERSIRHSPAQEGQQWQDNGYFLLLLLIPVLISFFRHGGSVSAE